MGVMTKPPQKSQKAQNADLFDYDMFEKTETVVNPSAAQSIDFEI